MWFLFFVFFFSSRRRHTRSYGDWSSDVCSSDLTLARSFSSSASGTRRQPPALEALGEALFLDGVRPVRDRPDLDAGLLGRKDLPRVTQSGGIEGVLQPMHERKIRGREDERHEVGFFEADAVLAGDRSADFRADLHDLGAGRHRARLVARLARVVEAVGVEVA